MFAQARRWILAIGCVIAAACAAQSKETANSSRDAATSAVAYDAQGRLMLPGDYRSWPTIGAGLGMAYGPLREKAGEHPRFTNVFVNPDSHRAFLKTGAWPDRTMFILEVRSSVAVNKAESGSNGYFQGEIVGIEAEVKDVQRFAGGWAFFNMDVDERAGPQIPTSASCYSCHAKNAAVENTFVQFYPVLRDVAKQQGTFKTVAEVF